MNLLRVKENSRHNSVETIGRNKVLLGESMKVDGVASSFSWGVNMQKKLEKTDLTTETMQWNKTSIYRVPKWIKDLTDEQSYEPWLVSLGPFHHGKPNLLPMEEHKCRAMLHLAKRSNRKPEDFFDTINEVANELREAYQDLDKKWHRENSSFVEMMVTDGCFLLELVRVFTCIKEHGRVEGYADNDPVFSIHGFQTLIGVIQSDIMLMENQLPLLALERLVSVQDGTPTTALEINHKMCLILPVEKFPIMEDRRLHILDILHNSICHSCPQPEKADEEDTSVRTALPGPEENRLHIMDILRSSICGGCPQHEEADEEDTSIPTALPRPEDHRLHICGGSPQNEEADQEDIAISTATELREAGIHFKKSNTPWVHDISFENGVLSIPGQLVDEGTEKQWLNLRVFEQLHSSAGSHVINYLFVMDYLIDSERDAELLRSNGILTNYVSSDKALAYLFNKLTKGATTNQSEKLNTTLREINAHCRKRRNKWRAIFVRTYMRNPWVFISLIAAIILLLATLMQTVYTVVPFYTES